MISFAQEINRPVGLITEESDPRLPGVPRDAFTDAMARAVNGVAIVTTDGALGRWGLTVSSVASVSADPPLLLVAISRKSPVVQAVRGNGSLGVSLLSAEHASLADNFAGRADDGLPFDFDLAEWSRGAAGSPLLTAATAGFDCQLAGAVEAGSHTILFGRVVGVRTSPQGRPLLYTRRAYGSAGTL